MKISDFNEIIMNMPYLKFFFEIKRENWRVKEHNDSIDSIFSGNKTIALSRKDLYKSSDNIKSYIFKVLMWGYPTKGRGRNIENILANENLKKLIFILENYKDQNITLSEFNNDMRNIKGLGLSTFSKFTHFLNTKINNKRAVVLDNRIIQVINSNRFEDFSSFPKIRYNNAPTEYENYLNVVDSVSRKTGAVPDQIEMFLFMFGNNLKI